MNDSRFLIMLLKLRINNGHKKKGIQVLENKIKGIILLSWIVVQFKKKRNNYNENKQYEYTDRDIC
jgi:hypothetical protein